MNSELDETILQAIGRSFGASEHDEVARILLNASGGDRTRAAILVLADGDRAKLADLTERSTNDHRDVLMLLDMVTLEFPDLSIPEIARRYADLGLSPKYRAS